MIVTTEPNNQQILKFLKINYHVQTFKFRSIQDYHKRANTLIYKLFQ